MYDISSHSRSQVCLDQARTTNWAANPRARQMAAHTFPAHPARVAMTTKVTRCKQHPKQNNDQ